MKVSAVRLALAGLLIGLGCASSAGSDALRIGVGAPLSGVDAGFGNQVRLGVQEAVTDINANGGILGRQAEAVLGDDVSDPKKGVEVARRFVDSGIKLVVGHVNSAVTVAASTVYADAKVLDITPASQAPAVTDRGFPTIFRTCGRDDEQAEVAARFIIDRHLSKVAILHDRSSVGKKLADAVRKSLADRHIGTTFYGSIGDSSRDAGPIVTRIKASGPQIVFWGGGAQGAAQLGRPLRDSHIGLISGTMTASDDFANAPGAPADGTFIVFPKNPRTAPAAAELLNRFKAKNIEPDGYTFYAYAAVQVIRQAAEAAKSLDPEALAATMHSGKRFDTVLGPINFDAKGDPTSPDYIVYVWRRGPSGRMEFLDPANS